MKKWLVLMAALLCFVTSVQAEEYHLVFYGDWQHIQTPSYQATFADVFETAYPRLYARWGTAQSPTTVFFKADANDTESVAYSYSNHIVVTTDFANRKPTDRGYFVHELMHSIQAYGDKMEYDADSWWTEGMADYARFRYYQWAALEQMEASSMYAEDWMNWQFEAYGDSQWFFAYMDARYPTTVNDLGERRDGLIDAIHHLIHANEGETLSDNPYDPQTPFNRTVCAVTGYETMDALRLRYVQELQEGTWIFKGFAGYPDNFLTENLPGVENPQYPAWEPPVHTRKTAQPLEPVTSGENLCADALIVAASGYVNEKEAPELLIDGDMRTKWCSTQSHVTNMTYSMDGTKQWIVIDLGAEKQFNTYTMINTKTVEPYYGNVVCWELLISGDGENWTSVDYQSHSDMDRVSFDIGQQSARYLLLRSYDPDNGEVGTIRLYEFMLFQR